MVHVSTGNGLDVVYDYEDHLMVLKGLRRHGSEDIIPLTDPQGLINVLQRIIQEVKERNLIVRSMQEVHDGRINQP